MARIILSTLNARYIHASLALRYLHANLRAHKEHAVIREFLIKSRPVDIAEAILAENPEIVGFGVYIWNATQTLEVVRLIKSVRPEIYIVLGGPEVSYELEDQPIVGAADYVITGEGDVSFHDLVERITAGKRPLTKIITGVPPDLATLASPYEVYSDVDIKERILYVEASRGCPFRCEFCLSSLDTEVRSFPLDAFLADMDRLISRGARHIKFIDRTFNLNLRVAAAILRFFRRHADHGVFAHFEMIPDRLPPALRDIIADFPPGALQFEVGIQTFDPDTAARISRRQDMERTVDNLSFLRDHTGVHVHADLIVGLPGESLESFAQGFDQLVSLRPHEIQVGILKRLRGTPISRHDRDFDVVFSKTPPYEILQNRDLPFALLQRLKRFARAWDLIGNSGNFKDSAPLLWGNGSPFHGFLQFCDWLFARIGPFTEISLPRLTELVLTYLVEQRGVDRTHAAALLAADYSRPGRGLPRFLADAAAPSLALRAARAASTGEQSIPARQARHLS